MSGLLVLIESGLAVGNPSAIVEVAQNADQLAARIFAMDEDAAREFGDPGKLAAYLRGTATPMLPDAQAALAGKPAPLGDPVVQKPSRKWIGRLGGSDKPAARSSTRVNDVQLSAATTAGSGTIDDLAAVLGVRVPLLHHPTARLVLGEFGIKPIRSGKRELWPLSSARASGRKLGRRLVHAVARAGCWVDGGSARTL